MAVLPTVEAEHVCCNRWAGNSGPPEIMRISLHLQVITEGDPSITEEDQQKHGWQNVGQISCHEFERILMRVPDFESKFYISF